MDASRSDQQNKPNAIHVPNHLVLRIAAKAQVDPKTLRRLLNGDTIRGMGEERIRAAIAEIVPRLLDALPPQRVYVNDAPK